METNTKCMSTKSKKTLEEKIKVMQHYLDGGMVISFNQIFQQDEDGELSWNWCDLDYDIYEEPKTKPSIDWSHVNKDYKYMATDEDGDTHLYNKKPYIEDYGVWNVSSGFCKSAEAFVSFVPGTCNWKDSLVERPEGI